VNALGYLAVHTAGNWLRERLGRFRRVRYVLALLAGAFYFWAIFFRHARTGGEDSPLASPELIVFGSVLALFPLAFWWVARPDLRALAFSDAERQMLFPAPLTRRALILYKLARAQLPVLLNVAIFTVIFAREGSAAEVAQRSLALWVIFTTMYLHRVGAALTRLAGRTPLASALLRAVPVLAIAGLLVAVALSVRRAVERIAGTPAVEEWGRIGREALSSGPAGAALAPLRAVVAPAFTPEPAAWLAAMTVAIAILAAHLVWVLRADTAFEDAAAVAGTRESGRDAARAEGRPVGRTRWSLPRLPLAAAGPPERAILWKNTVPLLDALNPLVLIAFVVLVGLIGSLAAERLPGPLTPGLVVALAALTGLAGLTFFGPFAMRFDLRLDLPRLELLRAYPLAGAALVRAEVLAVAIPLAIMQAALLSIAFVASLAQPAITLPVGDRLALLAALALALPAVSLTATWVQNATALLFPDWVVTSPAGRGSGGGVEATGQQMLLLAGTWAVTLALLLPAAAAFGLVAVTARPLGAWALALGAAAASAMVLLEMRVLLRWLGGVFERTDPVEAGVGR
jgi:ABC-2 type transport system permease protein